MKNVTLTRGEAALFLVTLLVPLVVEAILALTVYPTLRWLLPTSILFPAGLLAGVAMRGGPALALRPQHTADEGATSVLGRAG